jgi:hypothetical protein
VWIKTNVFDELDRFIERKFEKAMCTILRLKTAQFVVSRAENFLLVLKCLNNWLRLPGGGVEALTNTVPVRPFQRIKECKYSVDLSFPYPSL